MSRPAPRKRAGGGAGGGSDGAPPAAAAPPPPPKTLLDVLAAVPHPLAAMMPSFKLAGVLAPVSRACADSSAAILRETVDIELHGVRFKGDHGSRFMHRLLSEIDMTSVTRLSLLMDVPEPWAVDLLLCGLSRLRTLHVYVGGDSTAYALVLPALLTTCSGTLTDVHLQVLLDAADVRGPSCRVALGRALARCASLTRVSLYTSLLNLSSPTSATTCLHANARVTDLGVWGETDVAPADRDRDAVTAARLVACAAARGALTYLAVQDIASTGAAARATLADAVTTAMPLLTILHLIGVHADWAVPRLPLLTTFTWEDSDDAVLLGRIIRHAPTLTRIAALGLPDSGAALDAALAERCADCDAAACSLVEGIAVDGCGALRLLSCLSLGPALRSLEITRGGRSLLEHADATDVLLALPPGVTTLTLYRDCAPSDRVRLFAMFSALPSVSAVVVKGNAAGRSAWQVTALRAAHMARRGAPITVSFPDGFGEKVRTQLALAPAAREPWMAPLSEE